MEPARPAPAAPVVPMAINNCGPFKGLDVSVREDESRTNVRPQTRIQTLHMFRMVLMSQPPDVCQDSINH